VTKYTLKEYILVNRTDLIQMLRD